MSEGELQALRGGAFVAAMALAFLLQRVAPHARLRGSVGVNGGLWLINGLAVGAICGACAFTAAGWAARENLGLLNWAGVHPLAAVPLSIAALDLVSYGWHRANHRVPALWRFHQVHHSDPTFTVSTGVRFHPGELLLALPVRLAAVVLLGASAAAVLAFEIVFALSNLIEHGDIDLPRRAEAKLERVLVTPALHRLHHTRTGPERDRNFGTILSIWDRCLRTYTPNDSTTTVDTGLPGIHHLGLSAALLLPARSRRRPLEQP